MINFLPIILLLVNGVNNMHTEFQAQQGDFKYVVSIQLSGSHLCTGTIIDERHILTIAHVLIDEPLSELSVVAATVLVIPQFFDSFPVQRVFLDRGFERLANPEEGAEDDWINDIAILRLTERLRWSHDCGPVQLATSEIDQSSCPECRMISWRSSSPDDRYPATFVQIWNFVLIKSEEECLESGIRVLQNEICFGDVSLNSLITIGKLGGTIVCDDVMIGFTTRVTENKASGTPSTFLNILAHSEFIKDVLASEPISVNSEEFSYIVSIWDSHYHSCGGLILTETHVLTAGYCVRHAEKDNLRVARGHHEISYRNSAYWLLVNDIIYRSSDLPANRVVGHARNDIAVLVVRGAYTFCGTFHPLRYENINDVSAELLCQSFHWKRTIDNNRRTMVELVTTHVRKVNNDKCRAMSMSIYLTDWQFCAGNPDYMRIADIRDIGNPIVCGGRPAGIMVRAYPMDDKSPPVAIFLMLHPYIEFIRSAVTLPYVAKHNAEDYDSE